MRTFVKNQQNVSREKYIFSCKHFGYYSDMIDTAKDSKFKLSDERGRPINQVLSKITVKGFASLTSPVRINFATSSLSSNNQSDIDYYEISGLSSDASQNKTTTSVINTPFNDAPGESVIKTLKPFNLFLF